MPAGDQPTLDVPPQLHDGNAEINCGFFDLEGTSIAKCDSFGPFLEPQTLAHRMIVRPEAEVEGKRPMDIVRELLDSVVVLQE